MSVEAKAERRKQRAARLKPTISVIGAGRLGTALAVALCSEGYTIEALVARRLEHARRSARLTGAHSLALTHRQLGGLPPSDILFITTPDDSIERVAEQLAETEKKCRARGVGAQSTGGRVVLHASGALSSDVLRSLKPLGFATGSMHPLVSVSDSVQGAESLGSAYFCVEGEARALRAARRLVSALGAQSFSINSGDKALYHAAAVMTSGHVTALFDIAVAMLVRCGLKQERAREVFLPLLRSTLENLYTCDPALALTGTFARADTRTVRRHLAALAAGEVPEALAAYKLLGLHSLRLAKAAGASTAALKEIRRLLTEGPE